MGRDMGKEIVEKLLSFEHNITEDKLAGLIGVSRTPLREALKHLELQGVIERKKKKGIGLRKATAKEIADVYDVRSVMEGFAGRLAAERATAEDLKELEHTAEKHQKAFERRNEKELDETNVAFHRKIVELSGNRVLAMIVDNLQILDPAFRLQNLILPAGKRKPNVYSHRKIIESLKKGDGPAAERMISAHIQESKLVLIERALGIRLNLNEREL